MTQAFALEADQKVALLNYDHTQAFVMQLGKREMTQAEMHQRFLVEGNNWSGGRAMSFVRGRTAMVKIQNQLFEKVGLDDEKLQEFLSPEDSQ